MKQRIKLFVTEYHLAFFRFVINVPGEDGEDNYVQAVKVEKCIRQGESCNIASSGFETTVCRSVTSNEAKNYVLKNWFQAKIYIQKTPGIWR